MELAGFQRVKPREANCVHEQGNCDHDTQNLQDVQSAVCAWKYGQRKFHSQEHKKRAVDEEADDFPRGIRDQFLPCEQRFIVLPTRKGNHQTRCYNSQNARNVKGFGKKIDKERREYLVQHVCDGVLVAQPSKHGVYGRKRKARDNTHGYAAHKEHCKRSRGIYQRKRARNRCRNGKLKCNNAGRVVDQGLSREERLLAMGQVNVGFKRGDGCRVGWSQGRGKRKSRS